MSIKVHQNAPLTIEGRQRLVERCRSRPIAHVAAEMGISRSTASKWVNRYRKFGAIGLLDRSSTPLRQPTATGGEVVGRVERMRRERKWSAARIEYEIALEAPRSAAARSRASCSNSDSTEGNTSTRTEMPIAHRGQSSLNALVTWCISM